MVQTISSMTISIFNCTIAENYVLNISNKESVFKNIMRWSNTVGCEEIHPKAFGHFFLFNHPWPNIWPPHNTKKKTILQELNT